MRGMMIAPGNGLVSNAPYFVNTTLGLLRSVANAERSVKSVSPFKSRPIVILNGVPEVTIKNGFNVMPHGAR